jgi:hypothetical protein
MADAGMSDPIVGSEIESILSNVENVFDGRRALVSLNAQNVGMKQMQIGMLP